MTQNEHQKREQLRRDAANVRSAFVNGVARRHCGGTAPRCAREVVQYMLLHHEDIVTMGGVPRQMVFKPMVAGVFEVTLKEIV